MISVRLSKRFLKNIGIILALLLIVTACGPQIDNSGGGENNGSENGTDSNGNTGEPSGDDGDGSSPEPSADTGPIDVDLVFVPGSRFLMGSDPDADPNAQPDEMPQHPVSLPGFYIFQKEVTNSQYAQCVEAGKCAPPVYQEDGPAANYGLPEFFEYPVVGVSWFQAQQFCEYTNGRLPTEAEWEKASRGETGDLYPWGNDPGTCDNANSDGCLPEPDTKGVGEYNPSGASPYGALNTIGNVWEWVHDWYAPDYYNNTPASSPEGPAIGKLKVVRGGGFASMVLELRSAERGALQPRMGYSDVGFRCVPDTEPQVGGFAPFCLQTYNPFCTPGGNPGTSIDVRIPDDCSEAGSDRTIRVAGIGCAEGGTVNVSVDTGAPSAEGQSLNVNGVPFTDCYELPDYPGRLYCNGPAPQGGTYATFEVCGGQGGGEINYLSPEPAALVSVNMLLSGPNLQSADLDDYCPEGYYYDQKNRTCIPEDTPGDDNCGPGFTLSALNYQCEPDDETSCPEGTTYNRELQSCVPNDGGDCPQDFYATYYPGSEIPTCEPETNDGGDGGLCPRGYYFNTEINCCSPLDGNNFGCEIGYYFDTYYNRCVPTTQTGCPIGFTYDRLEGCIPSEETCDPGQYTLAAYNPGCYPGGDNGNGGEELTPYSQPNRDDNGGCPPGTVYNGQYCEPVDGGGNGGGNGQELTPYSAPNRNCDPGYVMDDYGQCVPAGGGQNGNGCGEGTYLAAAFNTCVGTDDGCGLGYYLDRATGQCLPSGGPGSGCGAGYTFNPVLRCCVPDGPCPENGQLGTPEIGTLATLPYYPGAPTNYDPSQGYCDPGSNGCPPGYYFDTARNACLPPPGGGCGPGEIGQLATFSSYDPACDPGTNGCPEGTYLDTLSNTCRPTNEGGCPPGYAYDEKRDACYPDQSQQQCGEGYYFDYNLGYCLPDTQDGCPLGYYMDQAGACQPIPNNNNGLACPPGYQTEYATGACIPVGGCDEGCVTVIITMPDCSQPENQNPCKANERYDDQTQSCVPRNDTTSCTDYSAESCPSSCVVLETRINQFPYTVYSCVNP